MSHPLFRIEHLDVMRGQIIILREIDLHVDSGEVVTVIGPNGAGKSTLFGSILGLHKIIKGNIFLEDELINKSKRGKITRQIALVPQESAVFPFLTVFENIWIAKKRSKNQVLQDPVFDLFEVLKERLHQEAYKLSGGQRQMLALAMGMVKNPKLLMLDEPSLGLAPVLVQEIFDTVRKMSTQYQQSILISEQTPRILDISDRVYVIEGGQVRLHGRAEEFREDERIRKVYLGMEV